MEKNKWELVNPEGMVQNEDNRTNQHPGDLTGKTVVLHWNGKHNGNIFLTRINELLTEQIKDINVIKGWEVAPDTTRVSQSQERSKQTAQKLASLMPDIVISSTAD